MDTDIIEKNLTFKIAGRVAVVTGANRGLGKAFVAALLDEGVEKVYATARQVATLEGLVAQYKGEVVPVELDITDPDACDRAAKTCSDASILINNAGIALFSAFLSDETHSKARKEMETNYFGTLNMVRAFARVLRGSDASLIADECSAAGLVSVPVLGTYSASKAAERQAALSLPQ